MILVNRKTSARVNVEDQIVDVVEERSLEGAPTLTATISDPEWLLVNAQLLDLNVDGKLDHVETKWETEFFRLVRVSPQEDQLTLEFEDRVVSILRGYTKPKRHLATKGYTRARFIESMVREAQKDGHVIYFVTEELQTQDKIAKRKVPDTPPAQGGTGEMGFSRGDYAHLFVRGARADKTQRHLAAVSLTVAHDLDAPKRAQWALMEALITESSIRNLAGGDGTSVGILQLTAGKPDRRNVKSVVKRFLLEGFTGQGGAISIANTTALPAHLIAQKVQGSFDPTGSNYQEWEAEAKEWVRRFHGLKGSDPPERTLRAEGARFYQRGGLGQRESSWDAMNRLAREVNARLWVTDGVVRYAFDDTLFKQAPRNELHRLKASVLSTGFDWDQGKPVQEMEIDVEGHDLWPAQTLEYVDAGPASGRWIVWDVRRTRSSGTTNMTVHSPQAAKSVSAPDPVEGSVPVRKRGKGGGGGGGNAPPLQKGSVSVIKGGWRTIGTPGAGTHSWTSSPNNWESDNAVDLACQYGTPLYAAFDGRIGASFGYLGDPKDAGRFAGKRLHLIGAHDELYYAHLSLTRRGIGPGVLVKAGELLGWSGEANGVEHLHLGEKAGYTGGSGSGHPYINRYLNKKRQGIG